MCPTLTGSGRSSTSTARFKPAAPPKPSSGKRVGLAPNTSAARTLRFLPKLPRDTFDLGAGHRFGAAHSLASLPRLMEITPVPWLHKIRLKILAFLLGVALTAIGVVSLAGIPVWPVVGVAFAAVAVVVNRLSERVGRTTCANCGNALHDILPGEHGILCPRCGAFSQDVVGEPLASDFNTDADVDDAAEESEKGDGSPRTS